MKLADVIGRHVSDFEQLAGLAAQLLLGVSLVQNNVTLFVSLTSRLLQFGTRHRQIVFGIIELFGRRLR